MKAILRRVVVVIAFLAILFPCPVFAEDACEIAGYNDPLVCGVSGSDEETKLQESIRNVLNVVYLWVGIIAVIVIVIGGIRYMTSAGNQEKISGAKSTIAYSLIGLVVTLGAFAITNFAINALEGRTSGDIAAGGGTGDEDRKTIRGVTMISSTQMSIGETAKLRAKIIPDYAEDKTLSWSSTNPDVVSVTDDGVIEAIRVGVAKVTVKTSNDKTAICTVTVIKDVEVELVTVNPATLTLAKGKHQTIATKVLPRNAKNKTLEWSSSDDKIASVTSTGIVVAKKEGKATITAKAASGKKATVKVEVTSSGGDGIETVGSQANTNLKGKPHMRKETQKIIDDHRRDFTYNSFDSYMNKVGGYKKYVSSLGGVFGKFANVDKIPVKTAADLQVAAEYAWGLMTIWGGDYYGWHNVAWRNNNGWKGGKSDRFRLGMGFGGKKYGSHSESIDTKLKNKDNTNYVCSTMLGAFMTNTTLKYYYIEDDPGPRATMANRFGSFKDATKLQVGDVLYWITNPKSHVAIVGEVYKDYVIIYDGGSKFTSNGTYKFKIRRKSNQSEAMRGSDYSGTWIAVRPWKIDQNVTLKGINE